MAYPIEKKLVVGISSNALFDLKEEDNIFHNEGLDAYRKYQKEHESTVLKKGVAFPFVKRFLHINSINVKEQPVEVVLLSRNSPETGIRAFNSIKEYELDITRAAFMSGGSAIEYIDAFNISLFLSTNEADVTSAIRQGLPAGRILETDILDEDEGSIELRVAFDFDGVIADDEAERVYKERGLEEYHQYETEHGTEELGAGPLGDFFKKLSRFQRAETRKKQIDPTYKKILKTAIVTARNAPAHTRAINTLNAWGVEVDEMFLLGGIDKSRILNVLKPHLYFDDQVGHLDIDAAKNIPLVHIPFGIANKK
ncbi:5'-nucleotidase [Desulfovibrio intestinalis]|uniref:5'-nucleotidase n=1 Tax=Desulfovibrio intestinalis TaxID=58621 RepID=A0A7W8C1M4_9BACT|nr:5'-nucleotidase [Desulfovibrio intestinalis]MBB5143965.1 5'-nucleotidase [Desulfovibrio intestinalis]